MGTSSFSRRELTIVKDKQLHSLLKTIIHLPASGASSVLLCFVCTTPKS